jgi:hypothetical protein
LSESGERIDDSLKVAAHLNASREGWKKWDFIRGSVKKVLLRPKRAGHIRGSPRLLLNMYGVIYAGWSCWA